MKDKQRRESRKKGRLEGGRGMEMGRTCDNENKRVMNGWKGEDKKGEMRGSKKEEEREDGRAQRMRRP